jgi:hypothetical protein
MAEESTTPDLVELVRARVDPINVGDLDAILRLYAPGSVWEMSSFGMGTYERLAAIPDIDEARAAAERLAEERE